MLASLVNSIRKNWNMSDEKSKQDNIIIEKVRTNDGMTVQKKYTKIKPIGKGAFAQCFITENIQTKKRYATKIIAKEDRNRAKLLNELLIHQLFHHDNIVDFSHAFEDANNIYVFMELCENDSLEHLLNKKRSLALNEIQNLMLQLIQGLIYIHSKNVLHRDLKPKNIFLDKNNRIKIGDFGLAVKLQFDEQRKRNICGTPQYMGPEMIEGKGYGKEADIWALGIILYEIYKGKTPYVDSNNEKIMDNICNLNYSYCEKGIPKPALGLIKRILIKNPQLRPSLKEILQSQFFGYEEAETLMSSPRKQHGFNLNFQSPRSNRKQHVSPFSLVNSPRNHNSQNQKTVYVTEMEELNDQVVMYMLSNNSAGVLKKQSEILVQTNKLAQILFDKNGVPSIDHNPTNIDNVLKNSLDYFKKKCKKYSKTLQIKNNQKLVIYVSKITRYKNCVMLKLSNHIIQLRFLDRTSILINVKKLHLYAQYVDNQKDITQIKIKDILENNKNCFNDIENDKILFSQRILRSMIFKMGSESTILMDQNMSMANTL